VRDPFGQLLFASDPLQKVVLDVVELQHWGVFYSVDLDAVAVPAQLEERVPDHAAVYPALVEASDPPGSGCLVQQAHQAALEDFSAAAFVQNGEDRPDVFLAHCQSGPRELSFQLLEQAYSRLFEEIVGQTVQRSSLKDGDKVGYVSFFAEGYALHEQVDFLHHLGDLDGENDGQFLLILLSFSVVGREVELVWARLWFWNFFLFLVSH
jgi:hypothetical protein